MSKVKIFILFFVSLFLDMTILPKFTIYGISPTIAIAVIVVISMFAKSDKITYYGIFLGLVFDIVFGKIVGLRALSFYLISYYTFKNRKFEGATFSYGLIAAFISVLLNEIYLYVANIIRLGSINVGQFVNYFIQYISLSLAMNIVIYIVVYFIIDRIRKTENKKFFY